MAKDYYKILGVSKNASEKEIKQAYRKLAHQHHPDKVGAIGEEKFKEINEAYQVLSDSQKRARYDQFGTADTNGWDGFSAQGGRASGWDPRDFGGFGFSGGLGDIFENIFGQAFSQVQTELSITLTQAVLGAEIELQTTYGEKINLRIPEGTQDGQTFRFRGKGQPFKRGRGDLLITVRVQLPRRFSREQKELLEKLRDLGL